MEARITSPVLHSELLDPSDLLPHELCSPTLQALFSHCSPRQTESGHK